MDNKKPIVKVTWVDSVGQGGWHSIEDIEKFKINSNMFSASTPIYGNAYCSSKKPKLRQTFIPKHN